MSAHTKKRHAPRLGRKPLAVVLVLVFLCLSLVTQPARTLQPLPVPHVAQIRYSGPFLSPLYTTSVLGAETIDPIDIIRYINEEREKTGAQPLRINRTLTRAAERRAQVILKYQNFSHHDPHEGIELATVLPLFGYQFAYASENIGMGDSTAHAFVNGFMSSTSHRENLLDPRLIDTGVAIVSGPYHQYYVNIAVQLFAIPGGEKEYLGYSPEEKTVFNKTQKDIVAQLFKAKLNRAIHAFDAPERYEKEILYLTRQQTIVESLLRVMNENKPFTTDHVLLIEEYNTTVTELNSLG